LYQVQFHSYYRITEQQTQQAKNIRLLAATEGSSSIVFRKKKQAS